MSDVGDAVTGSLTVVGRSGAVLAVSTGLITTVALPSQALGADAMTSSLTSTFVPVSLSPAAGFSLAGTRTTAGAAGSDAVLKASSTATVTFETDAFRAVPAPVVRRPSVRPAVKTATSTRRATLARAASDRAAEEPDHRSAGRHAAADPTAKSGGPASDTSRKAARKATAPASKAAPKSTSKAAPKPAAKTTPKPARKKPTATAKPKPSTGRAKTGKHHPSAPAKTHHKVTHHAPPAPAGSARGSAVLAIASRYVGTPYVYGGTTPRGFDCSGFTGYVFRQLGVALPRTANEQMHATHRITRAQARPGDLVFFVSADRAYHVGILIGHGMMIAAPHSGATVSRERIWSASVVYGRP